MMTMINNAPSLLKRMKKFNAEISDSESIEIN